jgi:membrane protein DedA with SNARE-associated domain
VLRLRFSHPESYQEQIITLTRTQRMSLYQSHLLSIYGYWLIAVMVGLERVGIPFRAATILIFVSAFAATHGMNIYLIVAFASVAAIVGNIGGFLLGKTFGNWLLFRYGNRIGLNERRIKLSQYLFLKYGIYLLVIGQFFPLLRELGGFLSGANKIQWKTFLIANAAGGLLWSTIMGFGAYSIGKGAERTGAHLQVILAIGGAAVLTMVISYLRKNGRRLQALADESLAGPIEV